MTEISKKKAPQRSVLEIERTGSWGKVEYRHRLDCGHADVRKRPSKTPTIACVQCVLAKQMDDVVEKIPTKISDTQIVSSMSMGDIIDDSDYLTSGEVDIGKAKSMIASYFKVSPDAVDVAAEVDEYGKLRISYATVFLEAINIQSIVNRSA